MKKTKIIAWIVIPVFLLALGALYIFRPAIKPKSDLAQQSKLSEINSSKLLNLHSLRGMLSVIAAVVTGNPADIAQNSTQNFAPASGIKNQNIFSFAIIGDTKIFEDSPASGNLKKAVDSITKQNVDMTFAIGDLIFHCNDAAVCAKSYENWKSEMSPLVFKTYEVVGNHDRSSGSLADDIWQKEFDLPTNGPSGYNKQVYSFDFKNSHFVVLDTEKPKGGEVSKDQLAWLDQDLSVSKKQHTFLFYHEPAFPTGYKKRKSLDGNPKRRDALWKILVNHNVTAVFNGHEHIYTRKKVGNIYQFIVGNTDAPENATPKPGLFDYAYKGNFYSIVTVSGSKTNVSLYSVGGNLLNSFDFN